MMDLKVTTTIQKWKQKLTQIDCLNGYWILITMQNSKLTVRNGKEQRIFITQPCSNRGMPASWIVHEVLKEITIDERVIARRTKEWGTFNFQQQTDEIELYQMSHVVKKWMVFIVPCIFQCKNNAVSKLAVGKPKRKKRWWSMPKNQSTWSEFYSESPTYWAHWKGEWKRLFDSDAWIPLSEETPNTWKFSSQKWKGTIRTENQGNSN